MGHWKVLCLGRFGHSSNDFPKKSQWVENNPTNIRIFPTNICIFCLVSWYYADSFCRCLIWMLPDVRWVGFLPPKKKPVRNTWQNDHCEYGTHFDCPYQWRRKEFYNIVTCSVLGRLFSTPSGPASLSRWRLCVVVTVAGEDVEGWTGSGAEWRVTA